MEDDDPNHTRIRTRDAAARMLKRLTGGVALGAITGVGLLSAVSAYTIPGFVPYTQAATASRSTSTGSTSTSLQSSSSSVSSSSSSGVAVSGGS
jgi:hypothetical protein